MEDELEGEKKFPCIFGEEIREDCPIRKSFESVGKWVMPKEEMFAEVARVMMSLNLDVMSKLGALANFCRACPWLEFYKRRVLGA